MKGFILNLITLLLVLACLLLLVFNKPPKDTHTTYKVYNVNPKAMPRDTIIVEVTK